MLDSLVERYAPQFGDAATKIKRGDPISQVEADGLTEILIGVIEFDADWEPSEAGKKVDDLVGKILQYSENYFD